MKLRKKAFVNFACALALAGNSLGVRAQDKPRPQAQSQRTQEQSRQTKTIIKTSDGQIKEFTVENNGVVIVDQNGRRRPAINSQDNPQAQSESFQITVNSDLFNVQERDFVFVRSLGGAGQEATFNFVSSEMSFDNKLVKGAPFSADIENETIQTLGDGNRIIHKNDGSIHRDGEGRMRREQSVGAVGTFANGENFRTITLTDPVAGTIYTLEPNNRIARKMGNVRSPIPPPPPPAYTSPTAEAPKKISVSGGVLQGNALKKVQPPYPPVAKAAKASGVVQVQITVSEEGRVIDANVVSGHPLLRDATLEAARQWEFKPVELSGTPVKTQGILTFNFTLRDDTPHEPVNAISTSGGLPRSPGIKIGSNVESLGKQTIEGVEAEGKRTTTTIPAGAIGNERPIEMVTETWYSPELQTTIMSKRNDPRTGETTYRLTNIRRAEPDASLFQVPSDYTIKEGGGGAFSIGGAIETQPVMKKRVPNQ